MEYVHERKERTARPIEPVVLPVLDRDLFPLMYRYLTDRSLPYDLAISNGWYPTLEYDNFPRVVISASSRVNAWPYYQARLIVAAPSTIKRYVSPSAPRGDALVLVFPKYEALGSIVVEGPMDALAAAGMGYVGVGLMGNTPNSAVLDHIEEVIKIYGDCYVIPDRDAFQEGVYITAKLWVRGIRCTLKTIQGAKDLAELSPERRKTLVN